MWKILFDSVFDTWINEQEETLQDKVYAGILLLRQYGPSLPRPYADTVQGSRFPNMKELRVQYRGKPIRVFFAFDPIRQAYVLCAGDKTGDEKGFYVRMVPLADEIYQKHLDSLEG